MPNLSEIEVDVLLLCYTFCDQYGKVDMNIVVPWAQHKLGISLPLRQITLTQKHVDLLVRHVPEFPDISTIIAKSKKGANESPSA